MYGFTTNAYLFPIQYRHVLYEKFQWFKNRDRQSYQKNVLCCNSYPKPGWFFGSEKSSIQPSLQPSLSLEFRSKDSVILTKDHHDRTKISSLSLRLGRRGLYHESQMKTDDKDTRKETGDKALDDDQGKRFAILWLFPGLWQIQKSRIQLEAHPGLISITCALCCLA